MKEKEWERPLEKRQFLAEHGFLSSRGWHLDFSDSETAKHFYQSGTNQGHRGLVLEGTQVIDTRAQHSLKS